MFSYQTKEIMRFTFVHALLIKFIFVCLSFTAKAQTDISDITCLGNGKMAVYEHKADILQVFGPPYSAPSVMELRLDKEIEVVSKRDINTAIWHHTLMRNNRKIGEIVDFVVDDLPCFIRKIDISEPIIMTLKKPAISSWINNKASYPQSSIAGATLSKTPAGSYVYATYPTAVEAYHQLLLKGSCSLSDKSGEQYSITCLPGKSVLTVVGGPSYAECITNTKNILLKDPVELQEQTRKWWLEFSSRRIDFSKTIPANLPQRDKLIQTIDDVAVLIKTQQSTEGAVLAGHNYHLGYVRDQYGVSRGLLKLGYYSEAKAILEFYWKIWKKEGLLHNAQGIGMNAFHIHENDEVEQTGYLIQQAFDYLRKTNDNAFVKKIFPMLVWAWESQKKHLIKNMLPFNGDETYVAGGILPRSALFDGSAEATMLFITGGEQFLNWIQKNKLWTTAKIVENRKVLLQTKDSYGENFIEGSMLLTNNPNRMKGEKYPDFRHGVCESLVQPCEVFSWTQRTETNRYLCPLCFTTKTLPASIPEKYFLQSVSLTPLYINATVIPEAKLKGFVRDIISSYKKTGKLPSRPDGNSTVGYDFGLFLYSLSLFNEPLKDEIYTKMLGVLDNTGAWVEYYDNNKPMGTRYRPWESAINLEAAIVYAENYKDE